MADSSSGARTDSMEDQPAPPPTHRRPRMKEVSSRFMSPLLHSNSRPKPSDFPRSKSACRRLISRTDENHDPEMDKSRAWSVLTGERKTHHPRVKQNGESRDGHQSESRVSVRPDTPTVIGRDRVVPSRYKQIPNSVRRSSLRSSRDDSSSSTGTAAARLLREAASDVEEKLSRISMSSVDDMDSCSTATSSNQGTSSCPNSPLCVPNTKLRSSNNTRSSMPDVDKWIAERNLSNHVKSSSDCARSLNFSSSAKTVSLPPHPASHPRPGLDIKKGQKASNHAEDVHCLKLLNNHYLQWRFANAKAETSVHAQRQETEKKFYSVSQHLCKMRDNVARKQQELAVSRRINTLITIVESQMLYLDEWSALEEVYGIALSGTINALINCSMRIPISGDVTADSGELREALGSALKVLDSICLHMKRFFQKAEAMDTTVSELATLAGGERALIEESGYLVSKAYVSQIKESSIRSTIMQVSKSNHRHQTQKSGDPL